MKRRRLILLTLSTTVFLAVLAIPLSAWAKPIYSISDIGSPKTVIDFEKYDYGTPTPISEGGATISSPPGFSVAAKTYPDDENVSGKYLGFNPIDCYITFDQPVSQFGLGVYDPNFPDNQLIAYDADLNELERISLPYDAFAVTSIFAGFKRAQADIKKIALIHDPSDSIGIDNITFSQATTAPLPGVIWLLLGSDL